MIIITKTQVHETQSQFKCFSGNKFVLKDSQLVLI